MHKIIRIPGVEGKEMGETCTFHPTFRFGRGLPAPGGRWNVLTDLPL
ncbi:MAG: hypothetical protein LBK45_04595 [Tannerellaceae bacterium]|nr:hypothetical protein [Tannerellaceae bacterium]